MAVMVGMGEGGRSPFYILQLPINRPMAALLVVVVVVGNGHLRDPCKYHCVDFWKRLMTLLIHMCQRNPPEGK